MQFNKASIDLVRRIGKQAPSEYKSELKLANPELATVLESLYQHTESTDLKEQIARVFELTNEPFSHAVDTVTSNERIYRGKKIVAERADSDADTKTSEARRKMTYRGFEVDTTQK